MSIRITSTIEGFRRAGIAHSRAAKEYPDGFFTDAQLTQLEEEPRLVVTRLQDAGESDPSADQEGSVVPDSVPGGVDGTVENTATDDVAEGENLLQPLIDIISQLDPHNESLWNKDGSPKAANFPVGTKKEDRDNAWEFYQAGLDTTDATDQEEDA